MEKEKKVAVVVGVELGAVDYVKRETALKKQSVTNRTICG